MFPEKMLEVLKRPGVVAIVTQGPDGPHVVNTWNSYIRISAEGLLLIPAGYMHQTEANLSNDRRVLLTIGSHEVQGNFGPGTGFLIRGTADMVSTGADFDLMKSKYPWARGILAVTAASVTQTL